MGVLAVALHPLFEPGEWVWLNTAVAIVVLLVLFAFYLVPPRWGPLPLIEQLAVIGVLWIVLMVGLAKPAQDRFWKNCSRLSGDALERCHENGEEGTEKAALGL
jgi:hypothetical protein